MERTIHSSHSSIRSIRDLLFLAAVVDDAAGFDVEGDLADVEVGFVAETGGKLHEAVDIGKVGGQADGDANGPGAFVAAMLDELNTERRVVESEVRDLALEQATARGLDGPLVWAAGEGWHPGVVGIVAARLKEATNRPAVVIGLDGGEGKGSGRSVAGIDLGAAVQRLTAEGLALKGGGHRMAAGLTVDAVAATRCRDDA